MNTLPVIRTCSQCASCTPVRPFTEPMTYYCTRMHDLRALIVASAEPPKKCPLRLPAVAL